MKVEIQYPQVKKMIMHSDITVADSATLLQVKEVVLKDFWKGFAKVFPITIPHGRIEDITLKHKEIIAVGSDEKKEECKETVIDSDELLKKCLLVSTCFQAVFKEH